MPTPLTKAENYPITNLPNYSISTNSSIPKSPRQQLSVIRNDSIDAHLRRAQHLFFLIHRPGYDQLVGGVNFFYQPARKQFVVGRYVLHRKPAPAAQLPAGMGQSTQH